MDAYYCYHVVARRETRYGEAERRLRALLHRDPRNDWARLVLASVRGDQNGPDAEELYRAAADGLAARGDRKAEILARIFAATYYQVRGQAPLAGPHLSRARELVNDAADPPLSARVRVAEAWQSYRQGDYGGAVRMLDEVEPVVFGQGPPQLQSTWLSAKGIVCWGLGRHAEAMDQYRRQARLLHEQGDRYEEAVALGNIVFMAPILGMRREEMLPLAQQLLASSVVGGNRAMEARAHDYLAGLTAGTTAVEHGRRFLSLSRQTRRNSAVALALRRLAPLRAEEDPGEARLLLDEAAALAQAGGNLEEVARVQVARGTVAWITGPREAAIAGSLAALDTIEATRTQQPEALVRARRFSQWKEVYNTLAANLLAGRLLDGGTASAADVELAFHVTERRRARMLLDEMDAARVTGRAPASGPLPERHARALEGIVSAQRRLLQWARDDGERARTLAELERLESEEEALRAELARTDRTFAALRQPRLATLAELRDALAEDEALLSFQIGDPWPASPISAGPGRSWLIVQSRQATRIHPIDSELMPGVSLFLGLFERRDGSEAAASARLGAELLGEALGDLPAVKRLVIVPDEALHMVPFDALRVGEAAPLAARYEISIAPSATLWLRLRRAAALQASVPALILSDPALSAEPGASSERQWALAGGARLGSLPHARAEGGMVVRRLGGESRVLSGSAASEGHLKRSDLTRYALIHIAAHAVVDEAKPERSAILLAPGSPEEDGLLQIRELAALDLDGRVVVLSTCRSATGTLVGGEGLISLAQAFFQSGARTVVGTLWPMRDDDAARLFDGFYRRLAEGASVGEALADARRDRLRAGAPAAAWAGVVALGDGSAVPVPGGRPSRRARMWTGVLVLFLAVLAAILVRFRRLPPS